LPTFTDEQIRGFLRKESQDFCELLKGDPERARQEIQKRIKKLVTPKESSNGAVLEVSGDIELLRTGDVLDESPLVRKSDVHAHHRSVIDVMAMFQQLAVNGCMVTHRRHTYGYQREAWGIILPLGPGQPGRSCTGG
jgi:hypothetical protein